MVIGNFEIRRRGGRDPKREAQEEAARGNWRPTDRMIRKADPDYVKRFFLAESVRLDMRRQYARAVLLGKSRGENVERAQSRALDFWAEYAALDDVWLGDTPELKRAVAREQEV